MGDNSEKGKNPLNHDKDIGVGSKKKVQNTFPTHKKKYLSASEFERRAGCKSGHADSHISFDSGKTIHVVAQKLKKTPPKMLFEVIQKFVDCPINPKKFQTFNEYLQSAKEYHLAKNEAAKPL
ncbi:hypothetical protein H5410_021905 [Solanum commersonii]|uniref:Uncharacterized protein n=1 Tax=Solanum commersonii TaxID=4109 RepID=A0A9J5ZFL9_SOLCO|nr:hypothetical protein H5410_021905 [Solanum commersonii]